MKFQNFVRIIIFLSVAKSKSATVNNKEANQFCIVLGNGTNSPIAWYNAEGPLLTVPTKKYSSKVIVYDEDWKSSDSFNVNLGLIVDERWEEFPTIKLNKENNSFTINRDELKYLPLSFYLESDIEFSFYNNNNKEYSTKLLLKNSECKFTKGDGENKKKAFDSYKIWTHVYFIFHNSTIEIQNNDKSFNFSLSNGERVNQVKIQSNLSFFKIHEYNLTYTTKQLNLKTIDYISLTGSAYLNMFISICPNCAMGISFDKDERKINNTENKQIWKRIQSKYFENKSRVILQIWTQCKNTSNNNVFAIHDLRSFNDASALSEIREKKNCRKLKNNPISFIKNINQNINFTIEYLIPSTQNGLSENITPLIEEVKAEISGNNYIQVLWKSSSYLKNTTRVHINVTVIQTEDNATEWSEYVPVNNVCTKPNYNCKYVVEQLDYKFSTEYKIIVSLKSECEDVQESTTLITAPPKPFSSMDPISSCRKNICDLTLPQLKNCNINCTIFIFINKVGSQSESTSRFIKNIQMDLNKTIKGNYSLLLQESITYNKSEHYYINLRNISANESSVQKNLTVLILNEFCQKYNWTIYIITNNYEISGKELKIIIFSSVAIICILIIVGAFIILGKTYGTQFIFKSDCCNADLKVDMELSEMRNYKSNRRASKPLKAHLIDIQNPSNEISIKKFKEYLKKNLGDLKKEHQLIELTNLKHSTNYSEKLSNASRNRQSKYYSYDHSRVILENHKTAYIHANFINGFNKKNKYIATQTPKINTINDFWHMIWQEHVEYIIVLINITNDKSRKYPQYWPNEDQEITFDNYRIKNRKTEIYAHFSISSLEMKTDKDYRSIKHFHFIDWPDNGIPLYPNILVPFLEKIRAIEINANPFVVHCSNGFSNTGTFILCDIALDMVKVTSSLDFLNILYKIRDQRMGMVEEFKQYVLSHYLVYEYLHGKDFSFKTENCTLSNYEKLLQNNDSTNIIKYLKETDWQGKILNMMSMVENSNVPKNFFCIDNFNSSNKFMVMKCQPRKQAENFWKFLINYNVEIVVYLNDIDENMCKTVWPQNNIKEHFLNIGKIECTNESQSNLLIVNVIRKSLDVEIKKEIKFFSVKGWKKNSLIPDTTNCLLDLQEDLYNMCSSNKTPIVVMCHDGITACGLFIASAILLKKIEIENTVDIVMAVQQVQRQCKKFMKQEKQIEFLYKIALDYISTKGIYESNI